MDLLGHIGNSVVHCVLLLDSFWFRALFSTQLTIKLTVLSLLQLLYISFTKQDREAAEKLRWVTDWLRYMSPLDPEFAESCLLVYLTLLVYMNPITLDIRLDRRNTWDAQILQLFHYLNDSSTGKREVRAKLDCILIDMQRSNVNYSDCLVSNLMLKNRYQLGTSVANIKVDPRMIIDGHPMSSTMTRLMTDMSREYSNLYLLRQGDTRSSIWPKNRRNPWIDMMYKWCPIVKNLLVFNTVVTIHLMSMVFLKYSRDRRIAREIYERSWARSWMIFEFHLCHMYNSAPLISRLVELVLAIMDHFQLLVSLRSSVKRFRLKTVSLRNCRNPRDCEQMRLACNEDAIETYVKLRYFVDELQPLLDGAKRIINMAMLPSIVAIGIVLIHCKDTDNYDRFLSLMAIVFTVSFFNLIIIMTASFRAECAKIITWSWSVIYCMLVRPPDLGCQQEAPSDSCPTLPTASARNTHTEHHFNLRPDKVDEGHYDELAALVNSCLLSPHVRLLWERMMTEEEFVSRKLTCRIFGFYNVDFGSVMKYNFYLFSILMLYFKFK